METTMKQQEPRKFLSSQRAIVQFAIAEFSLAKETSNWPETEPVG